MTASCQAPKCKRPAVVAVTHRQLGTRRGCLPCARRAARMHRGLLRPWTWLTTTVRR